MDYRSLYMHFECGVWMYRSNAVKQVKEDMITTLSVCREITLDFCRKRNIIVRGIQSILRVFAPML
jgi:cardiolipin synthase